MEAERLARWAYNGTTVLLFAGTLALIAAIAWQTYQRGVCDRECAPRPGAVHGLSRCYCIEGREP